MSTDNEEKNSGYWYGSGLDAYWDKDYEEAVRCFTIAAEMGDADAQYELASCYELGEGVEKDVDTAIDWYARAADQGHSSAWYDLGAIALDRKQNKLAETCWLRAIEYGNKDAKGILGLLYKSRRPVNDFRLAARWLREAVEDDHTQNKNIIFHWAQCLEFGLGVDPDVEEAKRWYLEADDDEARIALCQLDAVYSTAGTPLDWQQIGVKSWNQVYDAMGRRSRSDVMYDRDEAVRWWIRAAEAGNTMAMLSLARFFGRGKSYHELPADKPQAHYWYRRAAELGDMEGVRIMCLHYFYGIGVPRDHKEARRWAIIFARYLYQRDGKAKWYIFDELGLKPRHYRTRRPRTKTRRAVTRHVNLWPLLGRTLLFALTVGAIALVFHMDRLTFVPISEQEALERAETVKVTLPEQTVRLVDNGKEKKLAVGSKVTVLGVYKSKLDRGNSPRVYWTNQQYLIKMRDGSLAYGPLMESAVGHPTLLPTGDTAVVKAVKKVKKHPEKQFGGGASAYEYAYTLEGRKETYALEDLKMHFPQRVAYQHGGIKPDVIEAARADTLANGKRAFWPTVRYTLYKVRPSTLKSGYFLYPRFQQWNEFLMKRWFRNLLTFVALIGAIHVLFRWVPRIPRHIKEAFDL